jgi:hypothetical protein
MGKEHKFMIVHKTKQLVSIVRPRKGSIFIKHQCADCGKSVPIEVDSYLTRLGVRSIKLGLMAAICAGSWFLVEDALGKSRRGGYILLGAIVMSIAFLIQTGKFFFCLANAEHWVHINSGTSGSGDDHKVEKVEEVDAWLERQRPGMS